MAYFMLGISQDEYEDDLHHFVFTNGTRGRADQNIRNPYGVKWLKALPVNPIQELGRPALGRPKNQGRHRVGMFGPDFFHY